MTDTSQQRGTGADLSAPVLDEARGRSWSRAIRPSDPEDRLGDWLHRTSIYLYFKSKDALVHALIDEEFEEPTDASRAVAAEGFGLEQLSEARAFVDFGLERPAYYEIMFLLRPERMERYPAGLAAPQPRGLRGAGLGRRGGPAPRDDRDDRPPRTRRPPDRPAGRRGLDEGP